MLNTHRKIYSPN